MGEKGVGKLSQETPPPREGEPMGVGKHLILCFSDNDTQFHSISSNCLVCTFDPSG